MIADVDDALRRLIEREAVNGTDVELVFDAPTKDWAARRNIPALDLYLYDIREDVASGARTGRWTCGGETASRPRPPSSRPATSSSPTS